MLSSREREQIQLKALEQALRAADLARIEPYPLLPVARADWPFALTQDDRDFLKIQRISLA